MKLVCTVVFLLNEEEQKIYMGRKTQKIGVGKFTGPGGKRQEGETLTACAAREVKEEVGVTIKESDLEKVAVISFHNGPDFEVVVHFFLVTKWSGQPRDGDEMKQGTWFPLWRLRWFPWSVKMMAADRRFMPLLLSGRKIIGWATYREGSNQGRLLHWHHQ